MTEKSSIVLSASFLITSGIVFSLEHIATMIYWFAQVFTGSYPTEPDYNPFLSNFFIIIFLILSLIFFAMFINLRGKRI
ncbi:hypothetical protein D6T70_06205 [Kurthia gibsonii]|uniref:hypothetical protein n=1 Tax=Kurthia gibsonii TaxID=33946 RepID=UPI000EB13030|nr:hypothetical protein [Kurthia gibsonii]RXH52427.1 hypothetical protein D6T70_06205 [Kurthia gibsonii]